MDDELRDLERRARERGDAASALAWAAALRRSGRDLEAAAAAFEARARGASREEVFELARPREGGGDALAPWPHPRGDSAATRRSRVEGPSEKARLLFEIDLGAEDAAWGHGPIVLPDGSIVVSLDRTERGGSYVKGFAPDGAPRFTVGLRENVSSPIATAGGEVVLATPRELVALAASGRELARTPLAPHVASGELTTWFTPAAWNRSLVVGDKVLGADGRVSELRGAGGRRLRARSAVASSSGLCFLIAKSYWFDTPAPPGSAPPIIVDPAALHAFGREGELRWTQPVSSETAHVAAGREHLLVFAGAELVRRESATGRLLETRPFGGPWLALDAEDQPAPLAAFGPPLLGAPVVDALGRRYAAVERGDLVGLSPLGEPLFATPLGLTRETLTGSLAIGPRRLYALVLRRERRSIICVGDV